VWAVDLPSYSSIQKIQQKIMNNPTLTIIARVNGFRKTTLAFDILPQSFFNG
jgi:hypothetical protein